MKGILGIKEITAIEGMVVIEATIEGVPRITLISFIAVISLLADIPLPLKGEFS